MDRRCDQIVNCRDKSDEMDCQLLVLDHWYNKKIAPFTLVSTQYCRGGLSLFQLLDW